VHVEIKPTTLTAEVDSHDSLDADPAESMAPLHRVINLSAVVLPFVGFVAAMVMLWGVAFNWTYLVLLVTMYLLTGLGITVGYHRLFTHRSFETNRVCTWIFAVLGSMAMEGPVLRWTAMHRLHHQHSDKELDPHSPHAHHHDEEGTGGVLGMLKGLWHAHMGWLFYADPPNFKRYVPDLEQDRVVSSVSRQFFLWVIVGMAIPAAIGGIVTGTWMGVLLGFLWGGPARIFLVHHITWSINSVCHVWGARPFRSHDHSRNNVLFGILGFGEGWHNNHHAFPTSARHGLAWWQLDTSYMLIKAMSYLGLAREIRVPDAVRIEAKRRKDF